MSSINEHTLEPKFHLINLLVYILSPSYPAHPGVGLAFNGRYIEGSRQQG